MPAFHSVTWVDSGREPTEKPDPRYPTGMVVDMAREALAVCTIDLPYPAKRCGHHHVKCSLCGLSVAITTAGRVDDPCKVRLACRTNRPAGAPN